MYLHKENLFCPFLKLCFWWSRLENFTCFGCDSVWNWLNTRPSLPKRWGWQGIRWSSHIPLSSKGLLTFYILLENNELIVEKYIYRVAHMFLPAFLVFQRLSWAQNWSDKKYFISIKRYNTKPLLIVK